MLPPTLQRWKPAARARTQVRLAALLWTGVGTGMSLAGVRWILGSGRLRALPLLLLAAAVGWAKGRFALQGTARRIAARIARRGDGTCLGGFLSWKTWLFVLGMMATGALLRRTALSRELLGIIYTAVGVALLLGSRVLWREQRHL